MIGKALPSGEEPPTFETWPETLVHEGTNRDGVTFQPHTYTHTNQ